MDNKKEELTWSQAIEKSIIALGYMATLKQIYQLAPTFKSFTGLTPDRTINERVQRDSNFVKIKPGLYALKNHLDKLPDEYNPLISKSPDEEEKITHSYIQGLLIEIGNFQKFKTFSPDKGSKYLNKRINDIITQLSLLNPSGYGVSSPQVLYVLGDLIYTTAYLLDKFVSSGK